MAQDPQDPGTLDMLDPVTVSRRPRGRPRKHPDAKAAQAAASRAYRERKRAARAARQSDDQLHSDVIALDHLPAWRRR
jgi:hypothetical protein